MKKLFSFAILVYLLFHSISLSQTKNLSGNWVGKLKLPTGAELTIVFKLSQTEEKYNASLDSPDQGAKDIPCGEVVVNNDFIRIDVPVVNGNYQGNIDWEMKAIKGQWSQSGSKLELNLDYKENYSGIFRPQEPKPPFPYKVEDVLIENEEDEVYLSGTLTMPENSKNLPAVILISGSGPQNRDEEIFGHKPFLVIADFLTRNGFAVLRYDDRGVGASTGNFASATTYDFANDVLAAVKFLKSRNEINVKNIGLIGHSEGGMIAQIAAVKNPEDISFIVMLAGVGIPGDELIMLQSEKIARVEGRPENEILKSLEYQKILVDKLKSDLPNDIIENDIRKILSDVFENLADLENDTKDNIQKSIDIQIKTIMSDWYRNFLRYNPSEYLEKIKTPVLALNGDKDVQVPSKENLSAIKRSLTKAGNKNFKVLEMKGLNHLFQKSETGAISEYGKLEETFSQSALDEILNWLKGVIK